MEHSLYMIIVQVGLCVWERGIKKKGSSVNCSMSRNYK